MPCALEPVTHVLFDLDGTLIDSEGFYEKIVADIAASYGKIYTREIRAKTLGTQELAMSEIAVELMGLPLTVEEFRSRLRKGIEAELTNPRLMPGAERLLRHLQKHNIPHAMATSGSKEATDIKLQHLQDLFASFSHKVMGSSDPDVKKGKPCPDIFLVCAARFANAPHPSKCLVFEDAPHGVTAARCAGMQSVMIPSKETAQELQQGATVVLKSLNDFKPEMFGLPKFEE